MRRVGITQRVEEVAAYGERRDCLDQQWFVLLEELNFLPIPLPNGLKSPDRYLEKAGLDGFILSGGNDLAHLPDAAGPAPERDRTETAVLEFAAKHRMPLLAVCRGLQMLNVHLGGRLVRVEGHVAQRHVVEPVPDTALAEREVNSFHGWGIPENGLASALVVTMRARDGTVEAVGHRALPWVGIMWHPERERPFDERDKVLIRQVLG